MKPAGAIRALAVLLATLAAVLLLASGPGTRFGAWHWTTGLSLLRWAVYAGAAAALVCIVALAVPRWRARPAILVIALAVAMGAAAVPLRFQQLARAVPPIHDISTDTQDPPRFVAVVPLRAGAPNPPGYAGGEVAAQQRKAYPDVQTLALAVPVADAFALAQRAASALEWEIVATDPAAGRIEATATTPWFGFKDDVVVRILPAGTSGSRVDVRSKSRVGRGDAGANAARIRAFLTMMRNA
ncbi:MAG TPA: DUF1499 domain-containing protein [Burkholderiales bacterium]|nr:DUF1499 domain-containing protein [Burkholderiales bacterium]